MIFREVQRFHENRFALVLMGGLSALYGVDLARQLVAGSGFLGTEIWLSAILAAGPLAFLQFPYLVTEVDRDRLRVRFPPTSGLRLTSEQIRSVDSVAYGPLREFGGWGYRIGWGKRAYNVSGKHGIRLTTNEGREYVIGSRRPDELAAAIAQLLATGPAGDPGGGRPQ